MNSAIGIEGGRGACQFGDFRLDPERRLLTDLRTGEPVAIRGKVFDALLYFAMHPGVVVPRDTLTRELWPRTVVEDNNLNKLIAALRRALGADAEHRYVVTVPGRGYQFVAPVQRLVDTAPAPSSPLVSRPRRARAAFVIAALAASGLLLAALTRERTSRAGAPGSLGAVLQARIITSFPGDELSPALSPDGSQVAFSWDGEDGNTDIHALPVGEATPLRLTRDPAVDRDPAWSPDGRRIAFLRQRDPRTLDVISIPALGGQETVLLRDVHMNFISREGAPRLAFSADGRHLLFTDQRPEDAAESSHHLYRLTLSDGTVVRLTRGSGVYDTSPALSVDGRLLAFTRWTAGERISRLFVHDLDAAGAVDGEPRAVPSASTISLHSPTWSADGRTLRYVAGDTIFEWRRGETPRPVHVAAGLLGGVARGSTVSALTFDRKPTPTRAVAARIEDLPDIWAIPLDPTTHAAKGTPQRRAPSTAVEQHPRLSPDGRTLAFVSHRSGNAAVWLADASGSNARQLTSLPSLVTGFPHWSPDGRRLAFHASFVGGERRIYVVDAEGGAPRQVGYGCCPEWSADGRHLWAQSIGDVNRIIRIGVDDGSRIELFPGDLPRETADGRSLVYAKIKEPGLFRRTLDGDVSFNREERLVTDYTPPVGGIAPAPDGFFYIGTTPTGVPRALRFYDAAKGEARDIAPVPGSAGLGLSLSPDGSELLYAAGAQQSGADLVLFDFADPSGH